MWECHLGLLDIDVINEEPGPAWTGLDSQSRAVHPNRITKISTQSVYQDFVLVEFQYDIR